LAGNKTGFKFLKTGIFYCYNIMCFEIANQDDRVLTLHPATLTAHQCDWYLAQSTYAIWWSWTAVYPYFTLQMIMRLMDKLGWW